MITFRGLSSAFRQLDVPPGKPVIAHSSLSAFGQVQGGADTLVGALLACFESVVSPTFTYKTMVVPEIGPPDNGLLYGHAEERNRAAEFYLPDLPADRLMGVCAETLRQHPRAVRSPHPILSFTGVNAGRYLSRQSLQEPLQPIADLAQAGGWVLLLGVDHTSNTSLHFAEAQAGRKRFTRWALTPLGVQECPNFPGCSFGFQNVSSQVAHLRRSLNFGSALLQAYPLAELIKETARLLRTDPLALLCSRPDCQCCQAVRSSIQTRKTN